MSSGSAESTPVIDSKDTPNQSVCNKELQATEIYQQMIAITKNIALKEALNSYVSSSLDFSVVLVDPILADDELKPFGSIKLCCNFSPFFSEFERSENTFLSDVTVLVTWRNIPEKRRVRKFKNGQKRNERSYFGVGIDAKEGLGLELVYPFSRRNKELVFNCLEDLINYLHSNHTPRSKQ